MSDTEEQRDGISYISLASVFESGEELESNPFLLDGTQKGSSTVHEECELLQTEGEGEKLPDSIVKVASDPGSEYIARALRLETLLIRQHIRAIREGFPFDCDRENGSTRIDRKAGED